VLSTNIAETSITVDDVTHVVDCGYVKELSYDPIGNVSTLQEVFISRAAGTDDNDACMMVMMMMMMMMIIIIMVMMMMRMTMTYKVSKGWVERVE